MKIAIIQFPGSNCERESALAVKRAGMEPVEVLWNEPEQTFRDCDAYIIVGGFAYEDRSRAGIIASLDPIMKILGEEGEKGKPVLGICNGAQVLVEAGLVPGLKNNRVAMALATNQRLKDGHVLGTGYYNAWTNVQLTAPCDRSPFSRHLDRGQWMTIPMAHAQGRFMMSQDLLTELQANDQTLFRYCDDAGSASPEFPINPNGSADNLAAVCNGPGNIVAMMPHPERTRAGDPIFTSMRDAAREDSRISAVTLKYDPTGISVEQYIRPQHSFEFLVDLIITDNEAISVQNALRHLGVDARVTRKTHWEIICEPGEDADLKDEIIATGELFNSNKELLAEREDPAGAISVLVRYKNDMEGQHKRDALKDWFQIDGIREVRKGTRWTVEPSDGGGDDFLETIIDTHILFNPFSQDCFLYE